MSGITTGFPTQRSLSSQFLVVAALLLSLVGGLFTVQAVSAAPTDDTNVDGSGGIVVNDPIETPVAEPTFVAIPSVTPSPQADLNDVVGDFADDVALPNGSSDLFFDAQICNPPVPGLIDDKFCAPDTSGFVGQVYSGSPGTYASFYYGPLPVEFSAVSAGPYMLSAKAIPLVTLTLICRTEDGAGNLINSVSGQGSLNLQIGHDLVYRCTMYQLPEGELPDEMAPAEDGPVTVMIQSLTCPVGTDPSLNFFGLIGRCNGPLRSAYYEVRTATGHYEADKTRSDGSLVFELHADVWTLSTERIAAFHPPVIYCNVKDFLGQEPAHYAPFMTYSYGDSGAVIALEQNLTWLCTIYNIPIDAGTGDDTADVSVTTYICPEGTTSPSLATCSQPFAGVTFHLLYSAETIVSTKQTDANGVATWQAPENLVDFGLAEEVPAGYRVADAALCARNGEEPTEYAVNEFGIIDLGSLTAMDAVSCAWFNIIDSSSPAAADASLDESFADVVTGSEGSPETVPIDEFASLEDGGQVESDEDSNAGVSSPAGYEYSLLPLEEDE